MKPEESTESTQTGVSLAPTPTLSLPFDDRAKGFDAEYKALVAKWGIYHLPVTLYDDSTIPGGRYGQALNPEKTLEESK